MIEIFAVKDAFRTMSSHRVLVLPVIFCFFDELLAPSYPSQSFISSGGKLRWQTWLIAFVWLLLEIFI